MSKSIKKNMSVEEIIIIGGSYAAILALKTVLSSKTKTFNITLISPNEFTFFNVAVPRLLIDNSLIDKTIFRLDEVIENLQKGTNHKVTHIKSTVTKVELDDKKVVTTNDKEYSYNYLIIASGSRSISPLWKLDNEKSNEYNIGSIKNFTNKIKQAKTIAIIGGGSTGVETAGELATEYPNKKVTIYTGSSGPLSGSLPNHVNSTTSKLEKLGVEIINNERVTTKDNEITLSNGKTKQYDLVIEAQKLIPNTEFLLKKYLDEQGFIKTDNYFRVPQNHEVIVIGDILSIGLHSLVDLNYNQKSIFENIIKFEIFKEGNKIKEYKRPKNPTMLVPIGKNGGVGAFNGWNFPNFLVWLFKSRDFMIPKAKDSLT
ncbi:uncharacterized protein KGF55_001363 [Candida pseudojiufengensis]|uniref:uncharacterized protein n=1 Tax=Candida pseudojiufengensis TaxID=497109 RepID=UPI002225202E|nr:uncharacterized protein KGF55_001363 [Candida pseudojiufengensis]KAI5965143.1 hypothetical protein KGF55_001363 [Candida pseudojiufengensis]